MSPTPKKGTRLQEMATPRKKTKGGTYDDLSLEAENQTPLPGRKQKLRAMLKKPASASPVKKPAANQKTLKKTWLKMYYKGSGAWAIRKAGGSQLFQIVSKGEKDVTAIIDQSLQKLEDGMDPDQVKEWAKSQ